MAEGELIKVKYVQRVRRGDQVHLYFRKGDYREGPLGSPDGSQALADEVKAIETRIAAVQLASRPKPGTLGGVLAIYNRAAEFTSNARSTQAGYQDYIDELIEDCGALPLGLITRTWVLAMRDAWAKRGHRAANLRLQVLKNALQPIIDDDTDDRLTTDPFNNVKKVRRPSDAGEAHPVWEDAEVEAAMALAIRRRNPGLARAIALGRYGGFRRGTICAIPLNARATGYGPQGDPHKRLVWITEKRKVLADKREDARLTKLLEETPSRALTIAYNARGLPWKPRQLNQAVDRLIEALVKDGKARETLTIHGLRHSRGVELAINGASDAEIMAQLEHATDRAAKIYRRQAERRKLADAGQDRIDQVLNLRAARRAKAAENDR